MGYIKLRYPVKNPFFRDKLLKWLKESSLYFAKTNDSGAEIIYKIKK